MVGFALVPVLPRGFDLIGGHKLERHAVHVAGTISLDRWQGEERVQVRIIDVAEPVTQP